jgi:hypothetical protein
MAKNTLVLLSAFGLLGVTAPNATIAAPPYSAAQAVPVGSVTSILNSGLVLRAGATRHLAATALTPLFLRDRVRTAAGQRMAIVLRDGTQVLLNSNTDIGIDFPVIHLYWGEIFTRAANSSLYHLVVGTSSATVAVSGTQFDLTSGTPNAGDTVLTVAAGSARLSNANRTVLVTARGQAAVHSSAAPTRPVVLPVTHIARVTRWANHVPLSREVPLPPHFRTSYLAGQASIAARLRLRTHPNDTNALVTLADADADEGNPLAAQAGYGRALTLLPRSDSAGRARVEVGLAATAIALSDPHGADVAASAAQRLDPTNLQADILRGSAAVARGDLGAALRWFATAHAHHPRAPEALVGEGFTRLLQRQDGGPCATV